MLGDFLIVDKKVLPEVYEKVIEVKQLLEDGNYTQVSEAIKAVGVSRSAFYKYKDHVFIPSKVSLERKALLSFVLSHEPGSLSNVLNMFSQYHCSVITINQNIPIQKKASVVVSLDIANMREDITILIKELDHLKGISKVSLLSIE